MPRFGTIKRQYPRVEVLRGYDPNEPRTKTQAFPVKSDVTILSGQVISLEWNGAQSQYEWVLGVTGNAMPYIAVADSGDEDVQEAGKLPALSVAGDFEIQIPFFKDGDTYNVDVPVTFDGTTGDIKATTAGSGAPILGFVTRNHGTQSPRRAQQQRCQSRRRDVPDFLSTQPRWGLTERNPSERTT